MQHVSKSFFVFFFILICSGISLPNQDGFTGFSLAANPSSYAKSQFFFFFFTFFPLFPFSLLSLPTLGTACPPPPSETPSPPVTSQCKLNAVNQLAVRLSVRAGEERAGKKGAPWPCSFYGRVFFQDVSPPGQIIQLCT